MNIPQRLAETDRLYEQHKVHRLKLLQEAEDLQIEMTKLQGEYRVLEELRADEDFVKNNKPKKALSKANVIEATPDNEDS